MGLSRPALAARARRLDAHSLWPLVVIALALPAVWPLLTSGLPTTFDGATHLLRLALLAQDIQEGQFYPRWMSGIMLGHGAPIINFYAPLSYYLVLALRFVAPTFGAALAAALVLLTVVSGWGMFLLARDLYGGQRWWPALVAATAYMYAPFLLTNVFIRGGLAEIGSFAALPWVLWSMRRLTSSDRPERWVLPLTLAIAAMVLSHALSLVLIPPFLVAYALVLCGARKKRFRKLAWLAAAAALAAGPTAFFWMPLAVERRHLAQGAYEVARNVFLEQNVWRWSNFLDVGFAFNYNYGLPVKLGLVQLVLLAVGIALTVRRSVEWTFFVIAALLIIVSLGAWALPLWLSNPLLIAVQFPWRLLGLLSLLIALFTGAILLRLPQQASFQAAGSAVLIVVIILFGMPRLAWMQPLPRALSELTLATAARYEKSTGNLGGAGYTGELTPRWANPSPTGKSRADERSGLSITLRSAGSFGFEGTVTSPAGGTATLLQYYFPGWEVRLDGAELRAYPAHDSGHLAFDVPAGRYALTVRWAGTPVQRTANALTLLSLAVLAGLTAWLIRPRWAAIVPLTVLVIAAVIFSRRAMDHPVIQPERPFDTAGMQLVGFRVSRDTPDSLLVFPYWLASSIDRDARIEWRLSDAAGNPVSEVTQAPYFDTAQSSSWTAGTLATDAVEFGLPADLPEGTYQLSARTMSPCCGDIVEIGEFQLPSPRRAVSPMDPSVSTQIRFGGNMHLEGYDLAISGHRLGNIGIDKQPLAIRPGDVLDYTLYWRSAGPVETDYRARVELVDSAGVGITGFEQVAGGFLHAPTTWDPYRLRPDTYRVTLPKDLPSGLYFIQARAYDPVSGKPLPAYDEAGNAIGDFAELHLAKVIETRAPEVQHAVGGHLDEAATLLGYDLSDGAGALRPGDQFTVTLYYRAKAPLPTDYTRFLQLVNPGLGMAAQADGYPQNGKNPTRTWVPGEVITDTVTLQVAPGAPPGDYVLLAGFYDLNNNAQRLPLRDARGQPAQDNVFTLQSIPVR